MDVAGTDDGKSNKNVMKIGIIEFFILYNMGSNGKKVKGGEF